VNLLVRLSIGVAAALSAAWIPTATRAGMAEAALYASEVPASVELPDGGVAVPLMAAESHPVVEVTIQGRPYRFQIETGAWFNTISARAARELGLTVDRRQETAIDGLAVGGARFGRLRAAVMDHPPGGDDGQLGLPAFADLLLTVDFGKHELRLARGALPAANGRDILPLESIGPLWGVPVTIGGKTFTGFIDTQSGNGLAMAPPMARMVAFAATPVVTGKVHGPAIGVAELTTARLDGDLAFGGYRVERPLVNSYPVALRFPHLGVWLGPPLLSNFVLTLDQKNRLARFERAGDPVIAAAPALTRMGFAVEYAPDGVLTVVGVAPGGQAAQDGLSPGDKILTIDGETVASLDVDEGEFRARGGPVRMRLSRGGVERDLEVRPTVLVP
jgi:hypothetical protein